MALTLGSMEVLISANVQSAIVNIQSFQRNLEGAVRSSQAAVNRLAGLLSSIPVLTTAAFGTFATKVGADFEVAITNVNSLLSANRDEFEALAQTVTREATSLGVASRGAADAMYQIVSAGFSANDALLVMNASIKAGIAGLTDTRTAADTITTVLNAFGKSAKESSTVAGQLFQVVKDGKTTFEELAAGIGGVASLAASAGVSFEEVAAVMATLTKNGVRTEIAFTQLRAIIAGLLKPMDESRVALEKLLGTTIETAIRTRGFAAVLQEIVNFANASQDSATALSELFPNVRALAGAAVFTKDSLRGLNEELDKIGGAGTRTLDEVFRIQNQTILRQFAILKNTILNTLNIIVFENREAIVDIIQTIQKWIEQNKKLVAQFIRLTIVAGGVATTLTGLGAALRIVGFGLGGLATATRALNILFSPLTATLAAANVAFRAMSTVVNGLFGVFQLLPIVVTAVTTVFTVFTKTIASLFTITGLVVGVMTGLKAVLLAVAAPISLIVGAVVTLSGAVGILAGGLVAVGAGFKLWNTYLRSSGDLASNVTGILDRMKLLLTNVIDAFRRWADEFVFFEKTEVIFERFAGFIGNIVRDVAEFVSEFLGLGDALITVRDAMEAVQRIAESMINILATVPLSLLFEEAALRAQLAWIKFKEFVGQLWDDIIDISKAGLVALAQGIAKLVSNAVDRVFSSKRTRQEIEKQTRLLVSESEQIAERLITNAERNGVELSAQRFNQLRESLVSNVYRIYDNVDELNRRFGENVTDTVRLSWKDLIDQASEFSDALSGARARRGLEARTSLEQQLADVVAKRNKAIADGLKEIEQRHEDNVAAQQQTTQAVADTMTVQQLLEDLLQGTTSQLQQQLELQEQLTAKTQERERHSSEILDNAKRELEILREQLGLRRETTNITDSLGAVRRATRIGPEAVQRESAESLKKILGGDIDPRSARDTVNNFAQTIESADELNKTFDILKSITDALYKSAQDVEQRARAVALARAITAGEVKREGEFLEEETRSRREQQRAQREIQQLTNKRNTILRTIARETGISGDTLLDLLSGEKDISDLTGRQHFELLNLAEQWGALSKTVRDIADAQQDTAEATSDANTAAEQVRDVAVRTSANADAPATAENTQNVLSAAVAESTTGLRNAVDSLSSTLVALMDNVLSTLRYVTDQLTALAEQVSRNTNSIQSIQQQLRRGANVGLGGQ